MENEDRKTVLTRRAVLGAAGVAGSALVVPGALAAGPPRERRTRKVYDTIVVGAGLAGLTTADILSRAGKDVVVLEARDRVGGRNLDVPIGDGQVIEMGGEWTGPGQTMVQALAKELGIGLFESYAKGDTVFVPIEKAEPVRYRGELPPLPLSVLSELAGLIKNLNEMAATLPPGRPWAAPRAAEFDRQSVATFLATQCGSPEAFGLAETGVASVYGESPALVSLLDLLAAIQGVGGDFETLVGSAQSVRFKGGPQQLSIGLAKRLRGRVRLETEVVAVERRDGQVRVETRTDTLVGRRVVLTPPRPLIGQIRFRPELPPAYTQLFQRQPMGAVTKINVIYDRPFWRDAGLSGSIVAAGGQARVAYDNSPPEGRPGVLVTFFEGDASRLGFHQDAKQRKQIALEFLASAVGPKALKPTQFHEVVWAEEVFTQGGYATYNPPGVLTALGGSTTGPVGPIHFAGDGTSDVWPGYMDGAIRSGHRAAAEILGKGGRQGSSGGGANRSR